MTEKQGQTDEKYWRGVLRQLEDAHDEVIRPVYPESNTGRVLQRRLHDAAQAVREFMTVRGW